MLLIFHLVKEDRTSKLRGHRATRKHNKDIQQEECATCIKQLVEDTNMTFSKKAIWSKLEILVASA